MSTTNTNSETKCAYPMQCASIVRNQTLGIEARLSPTDVKEGESPLEMYNHFSRFPVVLIGDDRKAATANIPIAEMQMLIRRSEYAMNKQMEREMSPVSASSDAPLSAAYTTRIVSGEMKGKTPAEVLLAEADGQNKLNQHYQWLQNNLSKYPNNKKIMDAIADAAALQKAGKLTQQVSRNTFSLLDIGMRPLIRKTNAKNNCFVYELSVSWVFDQNYPVQIEISNYYAPVTKTDKGLLNVQKKNMEKDSLVSVKMKLSFMEWNSVIEGVKRTMRIFENSHGAAAFQSASREDRKNRENFANSGNNANTVTPNTQNPQQANNPASDSASQAPAGQDTDDYFDYIASMAG